MTLVEPTLINSLELLAGSLELRSAPQSAKAVRKAAARITALEAENERLRKGIVRLSSPKMIDPELGAMCAEFTETFEAMAKEHQARCRFARALLERTDNGKA